jgi:hypothetical protein
MRPKKSGSPENHIEQKLTAILFTAIVGLLLLFLLASSFPREFLTTYRNTVPEGTPLLERVEQAVQIFDDLLVGEAPGYEGFIELYGATQKAMGKRTIPDPNYSYLFLTDHGQITYQINERDLTEPANKIVALKETLEQEKIPFLWVQAPFRLLDETEITPITFDYGDENADSFLAMLEQQGLSVLDLRISFREYRQQGISQQDLFFNTDHHWTIPAALKATETIAKTLADEYTVPIDPATFSEDQFQMTTQENSFIGSMGRRVGKIYGGVDRFTLVVPRFETDIQLWETDYGVTTQSRGSFEDAVLVKEYLEDPKMTANRYAAYHGDNEELVFINHKLPEGKILIIKDSFGVPVYSFLSLGVHEVRALDPRLYKGSISQYAKDYRPDVVIFIYNVDSLNQNMFQWED